MKKKKIISIIWDVVYFFLIICICTSGFLVFRSSYYSGIYVSGTSMYPTLRGANNDNDGDIADFGVMDTSNVAKKHIKRFDIVTTYFPFESSDYDSEGNLLSTASYKIKRVIAMPGETFKIIKGYLYVLDENNEFQYIPNTFVTSPESDGINYSPKDTINSLGEEYTITLNDDEYWLLGDHRNVSKDCHRSGPVKFENLVGVLVAIEGYGTLYTSEYVCAHCGNKDKNNNICSKCGYSMNAVHSLKNKHYHFPTFY